VALLVAVAANGVIGRGGALPWRLPDDLKHFKALTLDRAILMGRRTFESIGKPLPRRRSIVITRQRDYQPPGVEVASSFEKALELVAGEEIAFVIGGRAIYDAALPFADRLELTRVHAEVEGDVWFPQWDATHWQLIEQHHHPADEQHALAMTFETWQRARQTG